MSSVEGNAASVATRKRLDRERVLHAAVDLADREGIDSLSMRRLGGELGVEAMALYRHVGNKEELLDGMVDLVILEIDPPTAGGDWRQVFRGRVLSARRALLRHPWASAAIVSRGNASLSMMAYMDSMAGILRDGGFSVDLTHHAMHVLGSRVLGFVHGLYDDSNAAALDPVVVEQMREQLAGQFPRIAEILAKVSHDEATVVGAGCDDQWEFEFGLDLILDGLERKRLAGVN
jgi:AcrR family transcriptional regulator